MDRYDKVDIFSEDIDVDAASVKPPIPPLLPYLAYRAPIPIPMPILRKQKQWDSYKAEILKKKKPKNTKNKNQKPFAPPAKNNWQPIKVVGGPNTKGKIQKKIAVNLEMDRPNLKLIEETKKSIQLNLDKSKSLNSQQEQAAPKPIENKESIPEPSKAPEVANPALNQQQKIPQVTGAKGRMPASAFMNIDQESRKPKPYVPWTTISGSLHPAFVTYPKGIPKSFLTEKHIQSLQPYQQSPNIQTAANPPPAAGPVWEATIPSAKAPQPQPQPSWSTNLYGQAPSGYAPEPGQHRQDGQFEHGDQYGNIDQSVGPSGQEFGIEQQTFGGQTYVQPMFVQTEAIGTNMEEVNSTYSPSDAYADMTLPELNDDGLGESSDSQLSGSKRLSAFKRLGPVTQPKKPKLTINLMLDKEQAIREVVDESEGPDMAKYTPVLERPDIQTSLDDTVMKYVSFWPWKKMPAVRRTVTSRESKNMMQQEQEQMDEYYDKEKMFFGIVVTKYPPSWNKEDVLDVMLESLKGKSFIPCFIEFSKNECKFLVIRSRAALLAIHKMGFSCRKDDVVLKISILQLSLSVNQIDFIPRLILRKRLSMSMDGETELNLNQFTLAHDVSHFLYFPLSRVTNQSELMQLQSSVPWQLLTKLVLSRNKITTLSGCDLPNYTPKLKHLDLSYNCIEGISTLLSLRALPLNCLLLEGNPLCSDYIDPERYTKVLKMMFSGLREIDGVKLPLSGEFPPYKQNYSPPDAARVAAKLLETMFPLLDAAPPERAQCQELYAHDAVLTLTFMYKLRYGPIYKDYRALFSRARIMDEGEMDAIEGAAAIAKLIHRWPKLEHDPLTFTVDVLYHTDTTTILRISGIMKVTAETLAEDEHLLQFTRTLALHAPDAREYKITNEMVYWDMPAKEAARNAFRFTTVRSKNLNLKLDSPPDADLKEKLLNIFMKITNLDQKGSERCLEEKEWHLRNALEYFAILLKLDNLDTLYA